MQLEIVRGAELPIKRGRFAPELLVKMDYDHRGDGVPTNLLSDFNGDAAADDKPASP